MKRRLLAIALASALLLTACSSGKNDRNEEETEASEQTVESAESTPTPEPGPSEEEVQSAYMDVLNEYSARIISYEQCGYSISYPSINYSDINGDGINELIFNYDSTADQEEDVSDYPDGIFANTAVYMYNVETQEADCVFDEMTFTNIGAWGMEADLVMLDDGNILRANMNGRMGYYTETYDEYQYDGTSYECINSWQLDLSIPDDQWDLPAEQRTVNPDGAMNGVESVPVDDFYAAQQDYLSRISCPLMPSVERFYSNDYSVDSILGGDWCGIPNSVFGQGNYMIYSVFAALASGGSVQPVPPEQVDETLMNAAYLEILYEYEPYLRQLEEAQYMEQPCVSLTDITGDGYPELVIQYVSDSLNGISAGDPNYYVCADIRIYSYDPSSCQAVEMDHIENAIANVAAGTYTDLLLTQDGHIILKTGWGDEDSETFIDEYEVQGYSLVQINQLFLGEYLNDTGDDYYYEYEYEFNGQEITEDQYNAYRDAYIESAVTAITWNPFYADEWYDDVWGNTILTLPNNSLYFDDAVGALS